MIKFEKKYLYTFADVEEAKKLIGKKGIFFNDCICDSDLKLMILDELLDVLDNTHILGIGFRNCVSIFHFFYFDPNLECKRAFYLEGKEIQSRVKNSACKDWNNCSRPMWDDGIEYRIKPETKEETLLTCREVAQWTSQGKGQLLRNGFIVAGFNYLEDLDNEVICDTKIRKWSDSEWHEPTREYIEGDNNEN